MAPPTTIATSQRQSQRLADDGEHGRRGADLRGAEAEHLAPHGQHARQRELQAQGEQQEGHPELGELPCRAGVRHDVQGVGTEDDSNHQVGERGREADTTRQRHQEDGACEENEDQSERRSHRRETLLSWQRFEL